MTTYLDTDTSTGASIIKTTLYTLPVYEIGQTVVYVKNNLQIESIICSIQQETFLTSDDEIISQVLYTLEDNESVLEEEIIEYYPLD